MYEYIAYVEVCRGTASPVGSKAQKTKKDIFSYLVQGTKQGTKENKIVLFCPSWLYSHIPGAWYRAYFCVILLINALPRPSLNNKKRDQLLRRLPGPRYIRAHIMALWGVSPC